VFSSVHRLALVPNSAPLQFRAILALCSRSAPIALPAPQAANGAIMVPEAAALIKQPLVLLAFQSMQPLALLTWRALRLAKFVQHAMLIPIAPTAKDLNFLHAVTLGHAPGRATLRSLRVHPSIALRSRIALHAPRIIVAGVRTMWLVSSASLKARV